MCSCDTSSGRTVSAQRQAAFSSCSRGAMALAQEAPPKSGRRRLRCRPNGLRHLPAKRTKCSLSQMASQSPVRATAAAPARARPARLAAKRRRRRHPTPPAPTDVEGVLPAAVSACAFPAAPAPPEPLTGRAAEGGAAVQGSLRCHVLTAAAVGEAASQPPGQRPAYHYSNKPTPEGQKVECPCLRYFPFNSGFTREATQRTP